MKMSRPIAGVALLLVVALAFGCAGPTGSGGRGALAAPTAGAPPDLQRVNTLEVGRGASRRGRERAPTAGAGRASAAERECDDEQQSDPSDRSGHLHPDPPLQDAPLSIRALPRDFTNEVREFRNEELVERQAAGVREAR